MVYSSFDYCNMFLFDLLLMGFDSDILLFIQHPKTNTIPLFVMLMLWHSFFNSYTTFMIILRLSMSFEGPITLSSQQSFLTSSVSSDLYFSIFEILLFLPKDYIFFSPLCFKLSLKASIWHHNLSFISGRNREGNEKC